MVRKTFFLLKTQIQPPQNQVIVKRFFQPGGVPTQQKLLSSTHVIETQFPDQTVLTMFA